MFLDACKSFFVLYWWLIEQKPLLISNVDGGENLEFKQTLQDDDGDDDDDKLYSALLSAPKSLMCVYVYIGS